MQTVEAFARFVSFLKAEPTTGYVLAPVLVPNKFDKAGDRIDEQDVEEAMRTFALNGRRIDFMHKELLSEEDVQVIESYVLRSASTINAVALPRGTWMLGLQLSPRLRAKVKSGEITGLSIRGAGVRTPVDE